MHKKPRLFQWQEVCSPGWASKFHIYRPCHNGVLSTPMWKRYPIFARFRFSRVSYPKLLNSPVDCRLGWMQWNPTWPHPLTWNDKPGTQLLKILHSLQQNPPARFIDSNWSSEGFVLIYYSSAYNFSNICRSVSIALNAIRRHIFGRLFNRIGSKN